MRWTAGVGGALVLAFSFASEAGGGTAENLGTTTIEQRIVPGAGDGFVTLGTGPGEPRIVREEGIGTAQGGREARRQSLVYFGQLSDFQLADEESPARVEFLDVGPFSAAWRPWEALNPQIDEAMIRQVNAFAAASPVAAGDGSRRPMDFTINTGDIADSQQLNETEWSRILMEGGPINPGSGIDPAASGDALCASLKPLIADANAPGNYTGVQDFDDYFEGVAPQFYDPDDPKGAFGAWPEHTGLMDRAQQPFEATGLDVPSYVTFGNHDALVQGNAFANAAYEAVATGCLKIISPAVVDPDSLAAALAALDPENLLDLLDTNPLAIGLVPPDPKRQFVSKEQWMDVWRDGTQADDHGFAYSDPGELAASGGAAGYYAFNPEPGFRFISLDTVSEAGVIGPSAEGNIDDPQFRWLRAELDQATAQGRLVVLFSHHGIPSLHAAVPDELAGPCTVDDPHGHDVNPGCDVDPRSSQPLHLGDEMVAFMHQYPNVIAWVAGHSHVNDVEAYPAPDGSGGFWGIRVAAEADWPQQSRLLEIFDNRDGTLSIFGTILDHASAATAPGDGVPAAGMDVADLASVGRTLSYNDTQQGAEACSPDPCGEGIPEDRNVELLVADPRAAGAGGRCANRLRGKRGRDRIAGTPLSDRISGRAGKDRLSGRGGKDCVRGGKGRDRAKGGAGADRVNGGKGADRIRGGGGKDVLRGGGGGDKVLARGGGRDKVRCGKGDGDRARVDRRDRVAGCERVSRRRRS